MKTPRVICTGCGLAIPEEGKGLWGDLWQADRLFIFNGVLKGFDTDWMYGAEMQALLERGRRHVFLHRPNYFDRRGVIVFAREDCTFSDPLRRFLKSNPDYHEGET